MTSLSGSLTALPRLDSAQVFANIATYKVSTSMSISQQLSLLHIQYLIMGSHHSGHMEWHVEIYISVFGKDAWWKGHHCSTENPYSSFYIKC